MMQLAIMDCLRVFLAAAAGTVALPPTQRPEVFRIGPEQLRIIVRGESEAATTSRPEVIHACMAAPDVVVLVIRAQSVKHGEQAPYEARPGYEVIVWRQHRCIRRGGNRIGALVGACTRGVYNPLRRS